MSVDRPPRSCFPRYLYSATVSNDWVMFSGASDRKSDCSSALRVHGSVPERMYLHFPIRITSCVGLFLPPNDELLTVRFSFADANSIVIFDDQSVCVRPTAFDEVDTVIRYFSSFHRT